VLAVAAGCKQLKEFDLSVCCNVNPAVAKASFPNTVTLLFDESDEDWDDDDEELDDDDDV